MIALNCSCSSVSGAVVIGILCVDGMEKEVVEKEVAVGVEKEVAVGVAVGVGIKEVEVEVEVEKEVGMGKEVETECKERSSVISLRIVATPCCAMVCICFNSCKCSAYDIVSPSSGSAVVHAPGAVDSVTSNMVCDFCMDLIESNGCSDSLSGSEALP